MTGRPVLELRGVSRIHPGGRRALDGVDLRWEPGLSALLGPNGAGKSTLMNIAATVTRPTSGQVVFDGRDTAADPDRLRRVLGYLPQNFGVYPRLTAREFLSYLAAAKGMRARTARSRISHLLELLNLTEAARRPLGGCSGGMLRRVGIAQALLTDPEVLIVDEPTAGLDPEERVRLRHLLADLANDRIVVVSTHTVSDIESVASDVVMISAGRVLRRATPAELLADIAGTVWEVLVDPAELAGYRRRFQIGAVLREPGGLRLRLVTPVRPASHATEVAPRLEDAYLAAVQRPSEVPG